MGDFFGRSGIADEMIRFNGYPYLDRDEHTFHIPGALLFDSAFPLMLTFVLALSFTGYAERAVHYVGHRHACQ